MLSFAMHEGNNVELVRLLVGAGADVDAKEDGSGKPMLSVAMGIDNNVELVRLLVGADADVNAREDGSGKSMLTVAISTGNLDIIQILVDAGATE